MNEALCPTDEGAKECKTRSLILSSLAKKSLFWWIEWTFEVLERSCLTVNWIPFIICYAAFEHAGLF